MWTKYVFVEKTKSTYSRNEDAFKKMMDLSASLTVYRFKRDVQTQLENNTIVFASPFTTSAEMCFPLQH
jgi:hypothetical protein